MRVERQRLHEGRARLIRMLPLGLRGAQQVVDRRVARVQRNGLLAESHGGLGITAHERGRAGVVVAGRRLRRQLPQRRRRDIEVGQIAGIGLQ